MANNSGNNPKNAPKKTSSKPIRPPSVSRRGNCFTVCLGSIPKGVSVDYQRISDSLSGIVLNPPKRI